MNFKAQFKEITGYDPFPWQEELFCSFSKGEIPKFIDIPTGCGKTKVMLVWLLALIHQAQNGAISLPRRLVWIVNRRTIVDQATEEAEKIAQKVKEISTYREVLASLSLLGSEEPLAVSTLRGELADNEKWKMDPSRPSIIVGTVDMIGSKLLFRGYGDGKGRRPYHAGLLGVDTLIVLDEAQLVPAFQRLLSEIERLQELYPKLKPFYVLHTSATLREKTGAFSLTEKDMKDPSLTRRLNAKKILKLIKVDGEGKINQKIVEIATSFENKRARVAVFVYSPTTAQEISKEIVEKIGDPRRVILLTGEIRGFERDGLGKNEVFSKFKFNPKGLPELDKTLYFVSTSAGEVGIDLDADHCVCDLTPIDSLIQRWGRINRGGLLESEVYVVYDKKIKSEEEKASPLEKSKHKTLRLLENLNGQNVGPATFRRIEIPHTAFSPEPFSPQLTERELDRWSQTSLSMEEIDPNGYFSIEYWLHGAEEEEEVYLVWREDIGYLLKSRFQLEQKKLEDVFQFYPPLTKEKLRARADRAKKFLERMKEKLGSEWPGVLIQTPGGEIRVADWSNLPRWVRNGVTIFLAAEMGGLSKEGYVDEDSIGQKASDVADFVEDRESVRTRVIARWVGSWVLKPMGTENLAEWCREKGIPYAVESLSGIGELKEGKFYFTGDLKELSRHLQKKWGVEKIVTDEDPNEEPIECIFYLRSKPEPEFQRGKEVPLNDHEKEVARIVDVLCEKLQLPFDVRSSLYRAAELHDEGKRNEDWQRKVIGNETPRILAKSPRGRGERIGYRHEFGSLVLNKDVNDLTLHLIASTHGNSRPTFERESLKCATKKYLGSEAKITEELCEEIRKSCPIRFSKLQKEWGYWNLAFLENILKAADWWVSLKEI